MRAIALARISALLLVSTAGAQTVSIPPVVVSTLSHAHYFSSPETTTYDMVQFPCTGGECNGPGFTASIGQNSTILIRFEAPAGNKFVVTRAPGGTQYFTAAAHWETNTSDVGSNFATAAIQFENLTGTPPTNTYSLSLVTNNGEVVVSENNYTVGGDFSFTAMEVQFVVPQALVPLSRTYNAVNSSSSPSFGSIRIVSGNASDATLMSIEPVGFTSLCDPGVGSVAGCPCSNPPGGTGRGCDNSASTGGASLSSSGAASLSADSLVFTTAGERPTATSILLQGTTFVSSGLVYGQGVRCVGGSLKRLFAKSAVGGSITAPNFGAGDPTVSVRSAAKGDTILPGQSRWYLVFYRDPTVLGGCPTSSTFNSTQTGAIHWSS